MKSWLFSSAGIALTLMATVADAQSVTLICRYPPLTMDGRTINQDRVLEIDEAAGTVSHNNFAPTPSTFRAQFTAADVTWRSPYQNNLWIDWRLDRRTGVLAQSVSGMSANTGQCERSRGDILKF